MEPFIIVTRGLPGSGKSTYADNIVRVVRNTVKVERDDLRKLHFKALGKLTKEQEELVTKTQEALVRTYIAAGVTVVVSDTNLPDRSVKRWQKIGHSLDVDVHVEEFRDVPLEVVLKNNAERDKWSTSSISKVVPEEVIQNMYDRFIKGRDLDVPVVWSPPAENKIDPYVQPDYGQTAVIFDIDGTLAVMGDRSPYDGAKVGIDTLNKDVYAALEHCGIAGVTIIIASGREEKYRAITEKWLDDNGVKYENLYMRPAGDHREDSIIKHELFQKYIAPENYKIVGVYDDRHRVLRMWRKLGLTTFHVNGPDAGNF